jgi:hypothetical protein
MKMTIKFTAQLKAGLKYDSEAGVYVTYAPSLGIYSQGETQSQAKAALEDAVGSFLIVAHKNGVLDKLLKSADLCPEEDEFIKVEGKILKEKLFDDIFDFPAAIYCAAMA